jgi:hypothetical protein
MFRNKSQNNRLHALITKLGIDEETKQELVYKYTNGRLTSSKTMLMHECQALINELQVMANRIPKNQDEIKADGQRKKMFSIAREMGWVTNGKVDPRLFQWIEKYGYLKKPLNDYTLAELPKLITQFEYVLKSHVHAKG